MNIKITPIFNDYVFIEDYINVLGYHDVPGRVTKVYSLFGTPFMLLIR